jgi:flagellar biosynthesis/type III secretory pathway protein FliH
MGKLIKTGIKCAIVVALWEKGKKVFAQAKKEIEDDKQKSYKEGYNNGVNAGFWGAREGKELKDLTSYF